jgi:benzoate-CoA ligase
MGSCGKPIYGVEVKLVDPATGEQITEPYKEGELWIKSDTNVFFYWRKHEKTRSTIVGEWVRTGDSLYFDEDGFFFYVDRIDDLFKVHGLWVSPGEVEGVLLKHPAVKDAAVIPKKAEDGFTYPKAFVVLKPGYTLTDQLVKELQELVRKEIGGYKVPRWIEAIDEIPRTTFQKINRRALREKEMASSSA